MRLTPWGRILLEKLVVGLRSASQIILLLWNQRVHCRVHRSLPLILVSSQMNPTTFYQPIYPRFILVLFSYVRLHIRVGSSL
jgi:hypothetical protein